MPKIKAHKAPSVPVDRPPRRRVDAVGCAVEIGQIATHQKDDPTPIEPSESILRALCDEENG